MLLKSLGGSMGSYSGLQCHMKGSIYTGFQGAVPWYLSEWSYGVFFIATLGAVQTLRVLFNGLWY